MTTAKRSRLLSIPKSDLDSLEATIETLENEYVMDQLERGASRKYRREELGTLEGT